MDKFALVFPYGVVTLLGLVIGSFLNVLIYRLPLRQSIAFPASHCTSCGTPILYRDNIPILGYLLLRGKCRSCGITISPLYPVIEFITGMMFLSLFAIRGPTVFFLSDVTLACVLLVALFIDLRHMIIPDRLTLPAGIIGIGFSLFFGIQGILRALSGAVIGFFILLVMALLGKALFKRESMGSGDFKFVIVTGLFLGPVGNLVALVLAVLFGGLWGMYRLAFRKSKAGDEIPFGPFIAAGCYVVLFFRAQVLGLVHAYLSLF